MNNLQITTSDNSKIHINGEITEKNWTEAFNQISIQIEQINQPVLCLENLTKGDSSALSLIMQLSQSARKLKKKLAIQNLPPFLAQLAKLYNLK